MKAVIRWTNKFSNETGYVKEFRKKEGCFVNTFDINSAKAYASKSTAKRIITLLKNTDEAINNEFDIISL